MKVKLYIRLTDLRDRFGFLSGPIDAIRYCGYFDEVFTEGGMARRIRHRQISNTTFLAIIAGIFCGAIFATLITKSNSVSEPCTQVTPSTRNEQKLPVIRPTQAPTATPTETPTTTPTLPRKRGMASYYSRVGCVGCSKTLTMANGQPLDDNALTVAYNHAPMGTKLMITNVKNGQTVTAVVTDTGGFGKLNRIADMTIATRDAIGCSNLCEVEIVEL